MSGIKNLKEKSKIQLDEMFDSKPVGKPGIQKNGKEEIKESIHLDIQQPINPIIQTTNNPETQPTSQKPTQPASQPPGKMENQPDGNPEIQMARQASVFSTKPHSPKEPTYKMTFNLTQEIYKAFNDLYANRMHQGKKTEKSELICEAIQWLIKMEEDT